MRRDRGNRAKPLSIATCYIPRAPSLTADRNLAVRPLCSPTTTVLLIALTEETAANKFSLFPSLRLLSPPRSTADHGFPPSINHTHADSPPSPLPASTLSFLYGPRISVVGDPRLSGQHHRLHHVFHFGMNVNVLSPDTHGTLAHYFAFALPLTVLAVTFISIRRLRLPRPPRHRFSCLNLALWISSAHRVAPHPVLQPLHSLF
ncbi:hypothetical protein R3P38DRAFT_3181657 [Favolaschia claudopus]|uniref:Uncharacterized protein n=1 Tax=Favolaschia claudopus TaxID=2862362 RepID=A0AAW0CN47_9AGAR